MASHGRTIGVQDKRRKFYKGGAKTKRRKAWYYRNIPFQGEQESARRRKQNA